MSQQNTFEMSGDFTEAELVNSLKSTFSIQKEQSFAQQLSLYDTFDWRLYRAGLLLCQYSNTMELQQLHKTDDPLCQTIDTVPKFVWDLPIGALKRRLEPIIEMRAFLQLAEISVYQTPYRLLNTDDKTVGRLTCETIEPKNAPQPQLKRLHITAVRGYKKIAKTLRRHFLKMQLKPEPENALLQLLATGERTPEDYVASLKVEIDPTMPADEAAKINLRSALKIMRLNEAGIKQDIDSEFLHDFRVAVRRTRSALSQIKGVFPPETTLRFKRDFAAIGKLSNDLRDLDVYLLAEDAFKAMLPESMRGNMDPLFDFLRQKRIIALQDVIDGLNAAHYQHTLQDWETFLNTPTDVTPEAPKAVMPIKPLAKKIIYKKYRLIVKRGNKILKNADDKQLHTLRIACKELRYLMDFFKSLFPNKKMNRLIKQVKKLQTNLGQFNDLSVQEQYLLHTTSELPKSFGTKDVLVGVGFLVAVIQQKREQLKANFAQTFTDFATPTNKKQFKKMFT